MDYFIVVVALVAGLVMGNLLADQATLRDCATKGVAKMAGGGSVKCEVVKGKLND